MVETFMAPGPWITRDLKPCVRATEYEHLKALAIEACQDMGCYCEGDEYREDREKCVMCKLSDAIRFGLAGSGEGKHE
jgi:hypothetical protein